MARTLRPRSPSQGVLSADPPRGDLIAAERKGDVVVGEAVDGEQAPAALRRGAADVVLMDVRMPNLDAQAVSFACETVLLRSSRRGRRILWTPVPARCQHGRAEEVAMPLTTARVPFWRCRVFRVHRWTRHSTEDGGRYESCALCGEDRGPAGLGPMTTPPWPGRR